MARRTKEILRLMEAGMPRGAMARAISVSKRGAWAASGGRQREGQLVVVASHAEQDALHLAVGRVDSD